MKRKVLLLTGASTGLGLATARALVNCDHYHLILTAREASLGRFEKEGIRESEHIWIRPLDVVHQEERNRIVDEADRHLGGIDILINNAGYSLRAVVEHVTETERLRQMDINFRAPMALIRSVLPGMREKKWGKIINISSVGGMMAMPTMAVYSASKFALEGASESLWYEVRPWNIQVTLVQPGFIHSNSFQNVKLTKQSQRSYDDPCDAYHHHYTSMTPFIAKLMNLSPATPEQVAKVVLKALRKKRAPLRMSGTPDAFFFGFLRRLLPRSIYHRLLYRSLPNIGQWGSPPPDYCELPSSNKNDPQA